MGILVFDGVDDKIADIFIPADIGNLPTGAYTLAWGARFDGPLASTWYALSYLFDAGNAVAGLSYSGSLGDPLLDVGGGSGFGAMNMAADTDYVFVLRKGAGTVTPFLSTTSDGVSWAHHNGGATMGNQLQADELSFGVWESDVDWFDGHLAWFAAWDGEMSESDAEALLPNWRTSDLANSGHGVPVCLIEFNTDTPLDLMENANNIVVDGPTVDSGQTFSAWTFDGLGVSLQQFRPDADVTTTGWSSTPLWSKIEEASADGTVITATAV